MKTWNSVITYTVFLTGAEYVLNEALEQNIKEWFLYNASEHYQLEEDN
tara:strand:- start:1579 stop:1722 length:144 start_codon:yes stop_codon:yes gene_type:complete